MLKINSNFNDEVLNKRLLKRIAKEVFLYLGLKGKACIELVLVDKEGIRALNLERRGVDKHTDVLSFPYIGAMDFSLPFNKKNYPFDSIGGVVMAGSVVICPTVAKEQAEEFGHSLKREMCYLLVHGILHIFGFDHINDSDKHTMRSNEERILNAFFAKK